MAKTVSVEVKKWLRTSPIPGVQKARASYLLDVGQFIRGQARTNVRKRTRALMNSIKRSGVEPSVTGKTVAVRVYSTEPVKAAWEERGTGIYGPRKKRIRPKRARALRWAAGYGRLVNPLQGRPKVRRGRAPAKSYNWIFARSVKGKKGTKFMQRAATGPETKAYEASRKAQMEAEIKAAIGKAVK